MLDLRLGFVTIRFAPIDLFNGAEAFDADKDILGREIFCVKMCAWPSSNGRELSLIG
jgi:hypothetical protein